MCLKSAETIPREGEGNLTLPARALSYASGPSALSRIEAFFYRDPGVSNEAGKRKAVRGGPDVV